MVQEGPLAVPGPRGRARGPRWGDRWCRRGGGATMDLHRWGVVKERVTGGQMGGAFPSGCSARPWRATNSTASSASSLRPVGNRPASVKCLSNSANPSRDAPDLSPSSATSSGSSVKCSTSSSSSSPRANVCSGRRTSRRRQATVRSTTGYVAPGDTLLNGTSAVGSLRLKARQVELTVFLPVGTEIGSCSSGPSSRCRATEA